MVENLIDFNGKNALVIGATTGIGRATAIAFARAGANVAIAGLGAEEGREAEAATRAAGQVDVFFKETDVRREADVKALLEAAISRFGRIHVAVNNAGTPGRMAPTQELAIEEFDNIVHTNLRGIWLGLKYELPHMLEQGGGAIVNMASNAGVKGMPQIAIYSASKHGVVGLTKSVALEVAGKGIRVNVIAPGPVETALFHTMVDGKIPVETIAKNNPIGRIGNPEEIAKAILFLCSDAASYMTGHVMLVDGGTTAK